MRRSFLGVFWTSLSRLELRKAKESINLNCPQLKEMSFSMFCTMAEIFPSVTVTGLSLPMIACPFLSVHMVVFSSVLPIAEMRWWLS